MAYTKYGDTMLDETDVTAFLMEASELIRAWGKGKSWWMSP
jgi:hypothetical protein